MHNLRSLSCLPCSRFASITIDEILKDNLIKPNYRPKKTLLNYFSRVSLITEEVSEENNFTRGLCFAIEQQWTAAVVQFCVIENLRPSLKFVAVMLIKDSLFLFCIQLMILCVSF